MNATVQMPGPRGFYEGTDKEGVFLRIPRMVDPDKDATKLAAHRPVLFSVSEPDDSMDLPEFDRRIEEQVPVGVLDRIDKVIKSAIFLAERGLADSPPASEREWRRGMILSWSHARDLAVAHDALGHPRYTMGHDVDEVVVARRLKENLTSADQWYRDYVESLDEGAWVNVGFFNPHLSASLYKWGDVGKAPGSIQNAMNAHRLAAHHNGTPERPLDWVERAVNFVVHHVPREHWGIRHEPRGSWHDVEERLAEDPAINRSEIGKAIARDAARIYELLEQEGKVVPWRLLKVPRGEVPVTAVEHALLVVSAAGAFEQQGAPADSLLDEDEALNPARVRRAISLLKEVRPQLDALSGQAGGQHALAERCLSWLRQHG